MDRFTLGTTRIGGDAPCFVIAEAGVNHNGSVELAHKLVDAAADAGADAVKFQTFDPDKLVAESAPKAEYQKRNDGDGSQRDMLARLTLSHAAHEELRRHAEARKLLFLSTPFDEDSADFLHALGVAGFKVASGEVTNHGLLAHLARKGRPVLLSTGMSSLPEVEAAVNVVRAAGGRELALFHCVSSYPAPPEQANLRAMATMRAAFGLPVGWSDHTAGIDVALWAVAAGAQLIEKHLTLDRGLPGPDHKASLPPGEFTAMTTDIRRVESTLGTGVKAAQPAEIDTAAVARRSLHWRQARPAGHVTTAADFIALRPGTGVSPARLADLVGRPLKAPVARGGMTRLDEIG